MTRATSPPRRHRPAAALAATAAAVLLAGCEIAETVVADAEDTVVAEVALRTDRAFQVALLHRTGAEAGVAGGTAAGADIVVRDANGDVALRFVEMSGLGVCVDLQRSTADPVGTCYAAGPGIDGSTAAPIATAGRYTLELTLPDGRTLTGSTRVPGAFRMVQPAPGRADGPRGCVLPPDTVLPLSWTRAEDAWVYVADTEISGLREGLGALGDVPEPLPLRGLSISAEDTTIVFPREFGVFDRLDLDSDLLTAIADGLPRGTHAHIVVAAADRNFVNWVRGGNFNPSGLVRVPSIHGRGGTGMFGALVPKELRVRVDWALPGEEACLGASGG